jgi:hypothetical protein
MPTRATKTLASTASITASAPIKFGEMGTTIASRYVEILGFIDRAHADPQRDWSTEIVNMFADPYKSSFIDGLNSMNKAGLHGVGHIAASAILSSIGTNTAELTTCVDVSESDLVDATGNSAVVGQSESNTWKFTEHVAMTFNDGDWKLSRVNADRAARC